MQTTRQSQAGLSLVEMLIIISIIGILSALIIPQVGDLFDASHGAKDRQNARNIESLSRSLAALGVAHVIPDSMGGVEATARLLSKGVIIPQGPMAGEMFILSGMGDEDITGLAKYLKIEYDLRELRIVYDEPDENSAVLHKNYDGFCVVWPVRIEKFLDGSTAKGWT